MDVALLYGVTVTMVGVVVWSIRQEGRINAHDQLFDERKQQAEDRHGEVINRLVRIEGKLDASNGKH